MRGWATAVSTRSPSAGSGWAPVELVDLGEPPAERAAVGCAARRPGRGTGSRSGAACPALPRNTPAVGSSAERAPLSSSASSLPSALARPPPATAATTAARIGRPARLGLQGRRPGRPARRRTAAAHIAASWPTRPRRSAVLAASSSSSSQSCRERTSRCGRRGRSAARRVAVRVLEDHVGVDAAEAHRGHARPGSGASVRPQLGGRGTRSAGRVAGQLRVRVVRGRWPAGSPGGARPGSP